ncbi:hypothetical protein MCHI_002746 [Candidatus Magnetoovum chiemensis]|nr:hypothetical protein MCHI_002746 [Candidatus Magnetoovum chiemensis]
MAAIDILCNFFNKLSDILIMNKKSINKKCYKKTAQIGRVRRSAVRLKYQ